MSEIKVKNELLPQRCEICHQADCFDPIKNYCSRCGDINNLILNSSSKTSYSITRSLFYLMVGAVLGSMLHAIIFGAIIGFTFGTLKISWIKVLKNTIAYLWIFLSVILFSYIGSELITYGTLIGGIIGFAIGTISALKGEKYLNQVFPEKEVKQILK
jgi:hypothetical protein